jgi:hypothetical protein
MKLAIIVVALALPLSAAQAQMSSIANPGTPPNSGTPPQTTAAPPQQSAAPSSKAEQKAARKQRLYNTPSNKTVQELFEACMARHQAKKRGGKNAGENCRKMAQARGR